MSNPRKRGALRAMRRLDVVILCFTMKLASACCPNNCGGILQGRCDRGGDGTQCRCECNEQFTGPDCSLRTCPKGPAWFSIPRENEVAHTEMECSNMGKCDRTLGMCVCEFGFSGKSCDRMACPNLCNNRGKCVTNRMKAEGKDPGLGAIHLYDTPWDADRIQTCECDWPYFGTECLFKYCPTGDDPQTTGQVNEKQAIVCTASGGYFTLLWKKKPSVRIMHDDDLATLQTKIQAIPGLRQVAVSFDASVAPLQVGVCNATGPARVIVEFLQDFGDVRMLHSRTTALTGGALSISEAVKGTKEDAECSNHGLCDPVTGLCTCGVGMDVTSDGYGGPGNAVNNRGDCGYALAPVTACPGEVACSGHGLCSGAPTYVCTCVEGWAGGDCANRMCNSAPAWTDLPSADNVAHARVECSNMGTCDRTKGECQCNFGFTGAACDRLACPGSPPCNGHGQCVSLQLAAGMNKINGESRPVTYGATPNDPVRWDYAAVQGCVCDDGFSGHDCSLIDCPRGDDPLTRGGSPEIQVVHCTATTGSFTLQFRDLETTPISFLATEAELKAELEKLSSIGTVDVVFTDKAAANTTETKTAADRVCTALGTNRAIVTFKTDFGDLPAMKAPTLRFIANLVIETDGTGFSVRGTKENDMCSNRGLCDYSLGECQCFLGFGNSDGFGNNGPRSDCGRHIHGGLDPKLFGGG